MTDGVEQHQIESDGAPKTLLIIHSLYLPINNVLMPDKNTDTFCPKNKNEWRNWLLKHHISKQSVWLICYKKSSGVPSIIWSESVEEALCFGWIDSVRKTIDEQRYKQFFSKRKSISTWSKINKDKVEYLIAKKRMSEAGYKSISEAKRNGSWSILDEVEKLIIPPDLEVAFQKHSGSKDFFLSLSKSGRKILLQWIVLAKRDTTRQNRIKQIAENAKEGKKPKAFR